MRKRNFGRLGVGCLVGLLATSATHAASITFLGGDDSHRKASAVFDYSGSSLKLTLTNNGSRPGKEPNNQSIYVLTQLLFSLPSGVTLTPMSAELGANSMLVGSGGYKPGDLESNWVYGVNKEWKTSDGKVKGVGVSSTGSHGFGKADLSFDADSTYAVARGLGSPSWGIGGPGFIPGKGSGNTPYIDHSIVFNFKVSGELTLSKITHVAFQYGTSDTNPRVDGEAVLPITDPGPSVNATIPLPPAVVAGSGLLAGLLFLRTRQR